MCSSSRSSSSTAGAHRGLELDLAVNLSTSDLLDPQLPEAVCAALGRWGVEPGRLTLEITESNMVSDSSGVATVLERLRQVGVRLAIDDFGTGYSSLTYLKHMPVSEVKVDRSFVTGMTEDPTNQTLVSSIVALGHQLGLRVVGRGRRGRSLPVGAEGARLRRGPGLPDQQAAVRRRALPLGRAAALGGRQHWLLGRALSVARDGETSCSRPGSRSGAQLSQLEGRPVPWPTLEPFRKCG